MINDQNNIEKPDVVLVGAGIMSATLGVLLKILHPDLQIKIFERLDVVAGESSDAWNNAGTGHSAYCELNYTPQSDDGSVDIKKAIKIAESFELSREFWAYLIKQNYLNTPESFIHNVPHMSFVWGAENVSYLKKRQQALIKNPLFKGMEFSDDVKQLETWMPLVMEGRDQSVPVAATRMEVGTDIDFGALTRALFDYLKSLNGVQLHLSTNVTDLRKIEDGSWDVKIKDMNTDEKAVVNAGFVFIGAGGGALPLLEKSDIKAAEGYGGFPVSGQWLRCTNPQIIEQHHAKVYGKASVGSPPMSVPHLDTRIIDGKKALLFGPFAGFSTKFLKNGSYWDLPGSLELDNVIPMISAGLHNLPLTKYLIHQARQSPDDRLKALREYFPNAQKEDWELVIAGQRVQVIKKDEEEGGVLEFGTEIVHDSDGSLAALLGASPGASTSVSIMLDILKSCFYTKLNYGGWKEKIKEMIPSYTKSLSEDEALCEDTRKKSSEALHLN
ncbi:MAG TPA: malate:quinone oxidoreductase [Bacteroidia bacterium]|jgi:malate dehydrogenase (quinone)|nr:malate:quinone oxidoreductase [Bacteroidia bacterium]HRG51267.1 malate:quinone oxidoreductase [Bacteroidia bacterium]